MCQCSSCEYTDGFSGLPDLFGEMSAKLRTANGRSIPGFAAWPRGEPAGKASAKAYGEHVQPMPKPWSYVSRPPQYSCHGTPGCGPIAPLPAFVRNWINGPTAYKSTGPVLPGPDARPAKPAKAPQHFPARDRTHETARIYAMPKSKTVAKRSRGRPELPGRFVVVKLEERLIHKAEKLGGKVAAGIREALERVKVG